VPDFALFSFSFPSFSLPFIPLYPLSILSSPLLSSSLSSPLFSSSPSFSNVFCRPGAKLKADSACWPPWPESTRRYHRWRGYRSLICPLLSAFPPALLPSSSLVYRSVRAPPSLSFSLACCPCLCFIVLQIGNQHAFQAKNQHISQQVFRISSNVSSIQRLVANLGTSKDSQEVRTKL